MTLAERAKQGPPAKIKGDPCSVGKLLRDLPKAEAGALRTMIAPGSGWECVEIQKALADEDIDVGRTSLERHRRALSGTGKNPCTCPQRGMV